MSDVTRMVYENLRDIVVIAMSLCVSNIVLKHTIRKNHLSMQLIQFHLPTQVKMMIYKIFLNYLLLSCYFLLFTLHIWFIYFIIQNIFLHHTHKYLSTYYENWP